MTHRVQKMYIPMYGGILAAILILGTTYMFATYSPYAPHSSSVSATSSLNPENAPTPPAVVEDADWVLQTVISFGALALLIVVVTVLSFRTKNR